MKRIPYTIILLTMIAMLASCVSVSEQRFRQAQQSMQQGNYTHAFNRAAESLQADMTNYQAMRLLLDVHQNAYTQELNSIEQYKAQKHWDQAAYGYDRIRSMNTSLSQIQQSLRVFRDSGKVADINWQTVDALLAIQPDRVNSQRNKAYLQAAEAHYIRAKSYLLSNALRQASQEFSKVLSFRNPYKDADSQARRTKHMADEADAQRLYAQGLLDVQQHRYRYAVSAFNEALVFIPNYKNARMLSQKYQLLADQKDALVLYQKGQKLAEHHQYRAAAQAFIATSQFIPSYRDADKLAKHYRQLADRKDARAYYAKGLVYMNQQEFTLAANAFKKANYFVPGFRDATALARKASLLSPPTKPQLRQLVQQSVQHGIPLSWLDDVHHGYTEEVSVAGIEVIRYGRFNQKHEFWPYKIRVYGACKLEVTKTDERQISFDTIVHYRVFRDDFGDWKAVFK